MQHNTPLSRPYVPGTYLVPHITAELAPGGVEVTSNNNRHVGCTVLLASRLLLLLLMLLLVPLLLPLLLL